MRSVFKWRVATNKYLYITDGNPIEGTYPYGRPFLFNKKESKAYYSNEESTLLPTGVDEGKIQQFVGNINNENIYRDMYNTMVDFAKHLTIDKDVQNLTLDVDYKPYFNLDNDTCVIEAVTPKCEGYEPVFDFRVHTVDDSGNTQVVNYDFYPERNEHDKTLRYVLDFEVPKGEKGDPGNDGAGCKGDKGDQGDPGPTPFFTATATASEATGDTADVTVEVTPDTSTKPRTYNLDFKFEIPAGTPGDPGNDGNDGKDDVFTGITASAERLGYDQVPYVKIYDDSSNRNVNRVKTIWNPEEIHDPDRGVDIDGRYESSFYMELGIPEGAPGIQGPEGRPSNIRIVDATVEETLEPGEQAQARAEVVRLESNNEYDIHLFFKIPRGQDGQDGTDGHDGQDSIRYNFSSEVIPDDTIDTIVLDWDQRFLPTEDAPTIIEETLQLYYPSSWGRGVEINLNGEDIEEKATFYAPLDGGEEGQVLVARGENEAPTWEDPSKTVVTLNGEVVEEPSFYAPTSAGTNGQYLKSNGSGAPTWETFPTIPAAANDGKLTVKAGTTVVREFTANQSSDNTLIFSGSGGTSVTGDANGNVTISTDSHYTVKTISNIVTTQQGTSAQQYNVECDYIPGSLTKVVDISTFATTKFVTPYKYVWTKGASETSKYIGLLGTQQTSGKTSCRVTINDTVTGEVESHYYAIIYDTPSDTTFTFITTNSWGMTLKWNSSYPERLFAYLNVPDTFVGTVTLEPIGYNFNAGNMAYSFEGDSSNITTSGWGSGDGTTKAMTLFDGSSLYGSNINPSDFRTPYGNYPVAIISDFNGSLAVGSKIQDALINAYMLQDMSKKVNTMYRMLFPTT